MSDFKVIGTNVPKVDARSKVTGRQAYADDLRMPGMLYGKIVRCWDYSHAKVAKLDLSQAAKAPGVVKVLGPKDVTAKMYNSGVLDLMVPGPIGQMLGDIEDQPIFTDHVKFQGDSIAGIIATSEEAAERAAELIEVEYDPLPVHLTAEDSMHPEAHQFTPFKEGNLAFRLPPEMFPDGGYAWGDAAAGMKEADLVVEDTFKLPKVKQCQMEPHTYVARYADDGRLVCWTSTQMPKCVHNKLARLFELPMSRVQVIQTTIGGGFGCRLGMIGEPHACAMAMAVQGRPVKVSQVREEDWQASESRHPGTYKMKIGFKKDGEPVAVDAHWISDGGGYYTHASGVQFTLGAWLAGTYKWTNFMFKGDRYFTNTAPCGAYRGYGNPQNNFAMEQLIDRGLNELGLDPVEWRKKWHKTVGDDGWCAGVPYASCGVDECLEKGAAAIGWDEKRKKYADQSGTKRRGIGCAIMTHTSGAMPMLLEHTTTTVKLNEDATAEVILSCSDLGTGAHTSLGQIAAETLGFPLEDVHVKAQDSDIAGFDIGAHASRTLYVGGGSVIEACEDVKNQILERAATALEANKDDLVMENKKVHVKGSPDKAIDVATICYQGVYNWVMPDTGQWIGIPGQIQGYSSYFPKHNSPPWSACFAEVEVDTETGAYQVLEMVAASDVGKAIHPPSVEGQVEGGIQQGLGQACMEDMIYDENGLCLNGNFTDYRTFGPSDMPKITNILIEEHDPFGPYGAKSAGEGGQVAPTGAVANAIGNALGCYFTEGPITPEKVLKAIKEKGL